MLLNKEAGSRDRENREKKKRRKNEQDLSQNEFRKLAGKGEGKTVEFVKKTSIELE